MDMVRVQLYLIMGGLALIIILYNIKSFNFFRYCGSLGLIISLGLLLMLLVHIKTPVLKAAKINEVYRVLELHLAGSSIQIHVFEIVKVAMILYLATAMDSLKSGVLSRWKALPEIWKKILFIFLPIIAVTAMVMVNSNSAAAIMGIIMFLVVALGGGNSKELTVLIAALVLLVFAAYGLYKVTDGKAMGRIGTAISRVLGHEDKIQNVLDATKGSKEYYDALDDIRQPYGAKIAVHEGGIIGKGPGQSTQRYVVPDMSEDYMFSFIIEEYGLVGAIIVIFLYLSLLARGAIIARNCGNEYFAKISVAGLCLLISGQAFLHMTVNVDMGPMTGQTLPIISHGASAFLCFCLAFGVILSLSRTAVRRINKETAGAKALIDPEQIKKDNVAATLDELDAIESDGNIHQDDEIQ